MSRKNDYDDTEELFSDLMKDIELTMQGSGDKKVKEIYKSHAEQSYRDYTPRTNGSRFRNGKSGSFADEVNFKEEVVVDGDTLTYTLENHRETDCDCAYCRSRKILIADYIENGVAGKSRILQKLVYENAQKSVDSEIESIIMTELSNKGW